MTTCACLRQISLMVLGIAAGLVLLAGAAAADRLDNGFYLGAQIGGQAAMDSDDTSNTYDFGYDIGLVGGYDFGQNYRVEAEWSYRSNNADPGSLDTNVVMGNVYFDVPFRNSRFVPYIGVGAGIAFISAGDMVVNGSREDDVNATFGYQAMAGLAYDISDNVTAGIEYRFLDTTEGDVGSGDLDLTSHNALLTIRYRFGN